MTAYSATLDDILAVLDIEDESTIYTSEIYRKNSSFNFSQLLSLSDSYSFADRRKFSELISLTDENRAAAMFRSFVLDFVLNPVFEAKLSRTFVESVTANPFKTYLSGILLQALSDGITLTDSQSHEIFIFFSENFTETDLSFLVHMLFIYNDLVTLNEGFTFVDITKTAAIVDMVDNPILHVMGLFFVEHPTLSDVIFKKAGLLFSNGLTISDIELLKAIGFLLTDSETVSLSASPFSFVIGMIDAVIASENLTFEEFIRLLDNLSLNDIIAIKSVLIKMSDVFTLTDINKIVTFLTKTLTTVSMSDILNYLLSKYLSDNSLIEDTLNRFLFYEILSGLSLADINVIKTIFLALTDSETAALSASPFSIQTVISQILSISEVADYSVFIHMLDNLTVTDLSYISEFFLMLLDLLSQTDVPFSIEFLRDTSLTGILTDNLYFELSKYLTDNPVVADVIMNKAIKRFIDDISLTDSYNVSVLFSLLENLTEKFVAVTGIEVNKNETLDAIEFFLARPILILTERLHTIDETLLFNLDYTLVTSMILNELKSIDLVTSTLLKGNLTDILQFLDKIGKSDGLSSNDVIVLKAMKLLIENSILVDVLYKQTGLALTEDISGLLSAIKVFEAIRELTDNFVNADIDLIYHLVKTPFTDSITLIEKFPKLKALVDKITLFIQPMFNFNFSHSLTSEKIELTDRFTLPVYLKLLIDSVLTSDEQIAFRFLKNFKDVIDLVPISLKQTITSKSDSVNMADFNRVITFLEHLSEILSISDLERIREAFLVVVDNMTVEDTLAFLSNVNLILEHLNADDRLKFELDKILTETELVSDITVVLQPLKRFTESLQTVDTAIRFEMLKTFAELFALYDKLPFFEFKKAFLTFLESVNLSEIAFQTAISLRKTLMKIMNDMNLPAVDISAIKSIDIQRDNTIVVVPTDLTVNPMGFYDFEVDETYNIYIYTTDRIKYDGWRDVIENQLTQAFLSKPYYVVNAKQFILLKVERMEDRSVSMRGGYVAVYKFTAKMVV